MRRNLVTFVLVALMLAYHFGMAAEKLHSRDGSLDQGGLYCNAATVIPGIVTHYMDTGYLDGDNDCATPFAWPYNEVFYKYTPPTDRSVIFRLQLSAFSANPALRIMADACCAGGTSVAWDTLTVAAGCDTGRSTYTHANLLAGVNYWIHVGDMSHAPRFIRYHFEMMCVECPAVESSIPHNTMETAQEIALDDSIMGDSAWEGHSDWYRFNVVEPDSIFIEEYGCEFGHCNSGIYPACPAILLNAHFSVYCGSEFGVQAIATGARDRCATDVRAALCLWPGAYFVEVKNYGLGTAGAWDYILNIRSQPTPEACWPPACLVVDPLCPGSEPITTLVSLVPPMPYPPFEEVNQCAKLDTAVATVIVLSVHNSSQYPVVTITPGCDDCSSPNACAGGQCDVWIYDSTAWVYHQDLPLGPRFVNTLRRDPAATGCCVCIRWVAIASLSAAGAKGDSRPVNPPTVSADLDGSGEAATSYFLYPNFPNPFNPSTQISFDLAEQGMTTLIVYNLMGQEVMTLVDGSLSAGRHVVSFDGSKLSSGIYLYRLKVNGFTAEGKMLLAR
jgi:hypothetical protein